MREVEACTIPEKGSYTSMNMKLLKYYSTMYEKCKHLDTKGVKLILFVAVK
jgi:hypothetical protein